MEVCNERGSWEFKKIDYLLTARIIRQLTAVCTEKSIIYIGLHIKAAHTQTRRAIFPWQVSCQVYFLVCTTNNLFYQFFSDQFYYEPACFRHVQILHVYLLYRPEDESNFNICAASSNHSISLSIFPGRPYTRTVLPVQKLAWPAFEPSSLSRKTCQFNKLYQTNRLTNSCSEYKAMHILRLHGHHNLNLRSGSILQIIAWHNP
jgi:hypothetical protein